MPNPPDRWTSYVELGGLSPADALTALSDAWTAYHTTYGVFPSVYAAFGTKMFYGGY